MATLERKGYVLPSGIIVGFIIGLALDIYEVNVFGDVGLGIVFGPLIGIILATVYSSLDRKKKR